MTQTADTSLEARESVEPVLGRMAAQVYALIAQSPTTCDDIERITGLSHQTASARVRELVLREEIEDSGERRRTRSGRRARVYRLNEGNKQAVTRSTRVTKAQRAQKALDELHKLHRAGGVVCVSCSKPFPCRTFLALKQYIECSA